MTEPLLMLLLVAGPGLWMLGGFRDKRWRRYVHPMVVFLVLLAAGIPKSSAIIASLGVLVTVHLGYGDRTPWPLKMLVFASYAVPAWAISRTGWWVMPLLCAGLLTLWMAISRRWNPFAHKLFEALAGLLQATSLVVASLAR